MNRCAGNRLALGAFVPGGLGDRECSNVLGCLGSLPKTGELFRVMRKLSKIEGTCSGCFGSVLELGEAFLIYYSMY